MSLLQFPCSGGINEAIRAEVVEPTDSWLNLENVRQTQRGVYDKRYGFTFLSSSRSDATTRMTGYKLLSFNGNPLVIDSTPTLDAYSFAGGTNFQRARVPECTARRRNLAGRTSFTNTSPSAVDTLSEGISIAYANGYYIVAVVEQTSTTQSSLNAHVADATTLEIVRSQRIPSSSTTQNIVPRMLAMGTDVVCVWDDGAGGLWGSRLSVASASSINTGWAARVSLAADYLSATGMYDACALTTRFVVSYTNTSVGTARVTVATYDPTVNALTQLQTTTSVTPSAAVTGLSCDGLESNVVWVAFGTSGSTAIKAEGRNPTTISSITITQATVLSAPFNSPFRITVGYTGTDECWLSATNIDPTPSTADWAISVYEKVNKSGGGAAQAGFSFQRVNGWMPQSKPFKYNGRVYQEWRHHDAVNSPAVALFDVTTASGMIRPVAWTAPRLRITGGATASGWAAQAIASPSSTVRACSGMVKASSISAAAIASEYDFANPTRWKPALGAGCILLSGGIPWSFDGQAAAEMAFIVPPRIDVAVTAGPGATGTFIYTALYEVTDAAGNVVWSDMAPVKSVTLTNQTATVTVQHLSATWRDGTDTSPLEPSGMRNLRIKVYATVNGGNLFYLIKTFLNVAAGTDLQYVDSTGGSVGSPQPYRSPGVNGAAQPRQCPPCIFDWCEYNGMIVAIGDDQTTIWYTPQHVAGEAIYFSDVFQFPLEQDGPCTAIAAMDGTCFIFKRRAIWAVSGEPASDNGAQGGLGTPRRLACDVGCIDPRSVVVTSKGIFFQSERGIELLTRAQTAEFVGEPVRVTTAAYPVCTAATLDSGSGRVYFELATTETANQVSGTGRTLVYNVTLGLWESKDRRTNASAVADYPAQSAALISTSAGWRYAWLGVDGVVYYEDRTTYLDPGSTWVQKLGETAHAKTGGLQGLQLTRSAMLLAKSSTSCNLSMQLRYDYNASYEAAQMHTDAQIAAIGLPNVQLQIPASDNAQGEAVALQVYDAAPTGGGSVSTGQGAQWIAVTFDIDPVPGPYPLPDGAR